MSSQFHPCGRCDGSQDHRLRLGSRGIVGLMAKPSILLCVGDSIKNLAPLIFKWLNILDSERTVEGTRCLWSGTSMLQKIRLVSSYQNILKLLPFEHEEAVSPCFFEYHQNAHQVWKRLRKPSGNMLL